MALLICAAVARTQIGAKHRSVGMPPDTRVAPVDAAARRHNGLLSCCACGEPQQHQKYPSWSSPIFSLLLTTFVGDVYCVSWAA